MTENDIQIFLNGAMNYFRGVSQTEAHLDTPYLRTTEDVLLDYTGAITISGQERGCVMFTAGRAMLQDLIHGLGDGDVSHDSCRDMVGEVANTISGNARREFGSDFFISVPLIFDATSNGGQLAEGSRTFVIPIHWNQHKSHLLVSLDS